MPKHKEVKTEDGLTLLTISETARRLKIARTTLQHHLNNTVHARIMRPHGGKNLVVWEVAQKIFKEMHDTNNRGRKSEIRQRLEADAVKNPEPINKNISEDNKNISDSTLPPEDDPGVIEIDGIPDMRISRRKMEHFKAQKAEIEFLKAKDQVVDVEVVKKDAMDMASRVRNNILNIAPRIAPELASMEDTLEIEKYLEKNFRDALEELAR